MNRITTRLFVLISAITLLSLGSKAQNCQCWQARDTSFHVVPFAKDSDGPKPVAPYYRNDDGFTKVIVLPFHFCFWGKSMDSVFINNNGNISFGQPYAAYSPDSFPLSNYAMVAPFWGDVDTRNSTSSTPSGVVWYKITSDYMIVQWDSVGYYNQGTDKRNTFQVIMSDGKSPIIPNGNNVEFCYKNMEWTTGDASSGSDGLGGYPATVGANKGDKSNFIQIGLFDTAGTKYVGQYPPGPAYDGVAWLDNQSFVFNTCSGTIAPLVAGVSPCDTLVICKGDTVDIGLSFLSPNLSDSTYSALSPPILSGVSFKSNKPGNTDFDTIQIIGNSSNYGLHTINIYGYDNETPHDTTYVSFVLEVDSGAGGTIVASKDTICTGDSVKLKGVTSGVGYLWSTGQTTDSIVVKPASTTVYTLRIGKGLCSTLVSKQIVVLNGGNVTASNDTICRGDSTVLTVTNATSYSWSTGATTSSIKVAPNSSTTYKVIANSACKIDTLSILVTVNPLPAVTFSGNDSICTGGSTTITASGGTSYKWSTGATTSSITVTPTKDSTYSVSVTNGTCIKDTSIKVVVKPLPVPTIVAKPDTVCIGDSALLIAGGGGSYVWTFSGQTSDSVKVGPTSTTTYNLQVTKDGCTAVTSIKVLVVGDTAPAISILKDSICQGDSTTITAKGGKSYKWLPGGQTTSSITAKSNITYSCVVTTPCRVDTLTAKLNVLPYPNVSFASIKPICAGQSIVLKASGGGVYKWSPGGSTADSIVVVPSATSTYSLSVSNGKCSKDTSITVTVNTPVPVTISPDPYTACPGQQVTFTANTSGGVSYLWSNGATTSSITVNADSSGTYKVVVSNGCPDSATTSLTVTPVTLNACCDTTITIGGSADIGANGSISYIWVPSSTLSCDTCPDPVASPTVTTTYTVTGTNSNGCKTERTVTVYVECIDFTVPNIFTPNNDGINDDFVIRALNFSSYSIVIYDRWGKEVYSSTDATKYWNGTIQNTQYLVPDGVYYYIIKATCGSENYDKKGFVEVVGGK